MKHLKIIVSLLLVFALVISISPVQAKADALAVGTVIAGVVGVGLILQAMGVRPSGGSGSSSWQSLCSSAYSYLQILGYATVNGIPLLTSEGRAFVMRDVVSALYDWWLTKYDYSDFASPGMHSGFSSSISIPGGSICYNSPLYECRVLVGNTKNIPIKSYTLYRVICSESSFEAHLDSGSRSPTCSNGSSGVSYYMSIDAISGCASDTPCDLSYNVSGGTLSSVYNYLKFAHPFAVGEGAVDGFYYDVVKPDVALDVDSTYVDWANRSITVPETGIDTDDPSIPVPGVYYPIYVPSPGEVIDQKTQEELQNPVAIETPEIPTVDPDGGILSWLATVLVSFLQRIVDGINNLSAKIVEGILSLYDNLVAIKDFLLNWLVSGIQSIIDAINIVSQKITDFTLPFWTWADSILQTVISGFTDVVTGIKSIPEAIAAAIAALFVPSVGFVEAKVEALRAQFGFADSIIGSIEVIKNSLDFSAAGPPVVYVNLAAAENGVKYGGLVPFIDMSWYARYKPTGDALLSSFFWVVFAWRTFVHLPGIISGASGNFVQIHNLEENYYKHNKR